LSDGEETGLLTLYCKTIKNQSLAYEKKLLEQGTIYFEMLKQGVYSN